MKAVIIEEFGGPEVLKYVDIPTPKPGPGQVLVRNVAINVGKPDMLVRSGQYPYLKGQLPLVLGNESAGYIEAVGEGVEDMPIGAPALVIHKPGFGAYAEYICVDKQYITLLPKEIEPQKAAGLAFFEIAYGMLNDAACGAKGKTLYILGGAGGLGTAIIKLALNDNWTVISSADTDEKCEYLRRIGAHHVFNCLKADTKEEIMNFTNGVGVDYIFDQLVGKTFFDQFDILADFGLIIVYNWLYGSPDTDFFPYMLNQAIHCSGVRPFSFHVYDNKPERMSEIENNVLSLIANGEVEPEFFGEPWPLSNAKEAHRLLDNGDIIGKMILNPSI